MVMVIGPYVQGKKRALSIIIYRLLTVLVIYLQYCIID
jgi:hypothetical protein